MIYLLTCKQLLKQYAGQIMDTLRFRWSNQKDKNRKILHSETCILEHRFRHFSSVSNNEF